MKSENRRLAYDVNYRMQGFSRFSTCEPDGKWESENRSINPIKFCNAPGCRSNGSNSNIGLTPTKLHFTCDRRTSSGNSQELS
uniref:Uncharacterized protein n=1 Tax=Vespula pensylvanica TaxID=30213 RepID=A0A834PFY1_VESPE|nr:hypothetical protein H0235_001547 [Vespula pensylvanica]